MNELIDPKIKKTLLLGNEAIVRGALEAGLSFATTYPGTPASEIGDTFSEIQNSKFKIQNLYFEYSTNEKVALEAAAGAAFSGLKAMVSMKHYGLNVALDSLLPLIYLECPLVVVVTDDPGCWSSVQAEQDSRWISFLGKIPTLEPADSQEAKEMTKFAFSLAWRYKIPVLVRLTTRVCHSKSLVKYGKIIPAKKLGKFIKNPVRAQSGSATSLKRHANLIKKIEKIKKEISEHMCFADSSPTNYEFKRITNKISGFPVPKLNLSFKGQGDLGIITSGVSFCYLKEILNELGLNLPIFKFGMSYPFPSDKVKQFISAKGRSASGGKNLKQVLIVEEIDPVLESKVTEIAKDINPKLKIFGKDLLPQVGEMRPEHILIALSKILKKPLPKELIEHQKTFDNLKIEKRLPNLCPGCPHRATFWAVKTVTQINTDVNTDQHRCIYGGDIGCYLLGAMPPYNLSDYMVAMGAGVGISHGVSKSIEQNPPSLTRYANASAWRKLRRAKPVAFIGDSTFFHAGIPSLINLVYNKSNVLLIILDNRVTAMTGHQPHPGTGSTGMGEETKALKIEDIVKACGADQVEVIQVYNLKDSIEKIKKMYQSSGVSVIVAKGECRLLTIRKLAKQGATWPKFEIVKQSPDLEILKDFNCPAIRKTKEGKYYIDQNVCWGCGFCQQIFPEYIKIKDKK